MLVLVWILVILREKFIFVGSLVMIWIVFDIFGLDLGLLGLVVGFGILKWIFVKEKLWIMFLNDCFGNGIGIVMLDKILVS